MIEYDNATSGNALGKSTLSWSHTCSGSNRILLVGVADYSTSPSSVTYGGNNLTLITSIYNSTTWWYLINPPTGSKTITITFSSSENFIAGIAVSYKGVTQTNPIDTYATKKIDATSCSVDISPSTGSMVVDLIFGFADYHNSSGTPGSGQTEVLDNYFLRENGGYEMRFSSYKLNATSMSYSTPETINWKYCAIAIKPVPETSNAFLSFF